MAELRFGLELQLVVSVGHEVSSCRLSASADKLICLVALVYVYFAVVKVIAGFCGSVTD